MEVSYSHRDRSTTAHVPAQTYRPDVDGLRAIAIVPVILFHARVAGFSGGYLGVDVFFVVSGFLITSLIGREIAEGRFTYLSFWERRARRLLPAMFAVVAATAFVACWLLLPNELESFAQTVVSIVLFSSNVYFWLNTGYFDAPAQTLPLLHTWSLAVEEQFYLLFPAVLMVAAWKRLNPVRVVISIGIVSFAISAWSAYAYPSAAYYLLPSRAWELMLGATLALWRSARTAHSTRANDGWLAFGLALVLIPVFLYDESTPFPGFAALVPCIGTALVIWFGDQRSHVSRLLDNRLAVFVGQLSYSLYLWHWPIIVFAGLLRDRTPAMFSPKLTLLVLGTTLACSWLSFVLIENPIRRRAILTTRRPLFVTLGASAALLAAFGTFAVLDRGWESRIPESARVIAAAADDRAPGWQICGRELGNIEERDLCRLGPDIGAPPRFLLWGDSHSLALFPAVDAAAKRAGVVGLLASMHSCAPVPGIDVMTKWNVDCSEFNDRVLRLIDSDRLDAVILVGHWSMYLKPGAVRPANGTVGGSPDQVLGKYLRSSIERLRSKGISVFVVDEVPFPTGFTPAQFARSLWWGGDTRAPGITVADYEDRIGAFTRTLAGQPGLARVTLDKYLCPNGSFCPAIMDGRSNYYDDSHLSAHGAAKLTDAFVRVLQSVDWKTS